MKYRITPHPRGGIPLGSCTASWPSQRSWREAEAELAMWREADDADRAIETTCQRVRQRLRAVFGVDEATRLILAPSGTDAVMLVSALALQRGGQVHHVVVGAGELGGGTFDAACGRTFSPTCPFGEEGPVGRPVEGLGGRCSAESVYLRHEDGTRKAPAEADAEVERRVDAALAEDRHVVLHLVAHSKTGLRSPSVSAATRLVERHGERLMVLVDAAQGRLAPADVRRARDLSFAVLFTGSKFYCGPPFSGVLVAPEAWSTDPGPLPPGLAGWYSRADLPRVWEQARASLHAPHNPGLALRWICALAEMEAYHAIPPRQRGRAYHTFAGAVLEAFGASPRLQVDMPLPPVHRLVTQLGAYPTVFGFQVLDPASGAPLGRDALTRIHALLDEDAPGGDAALAGRFHIGQPVVLGPPGPEAPAVLRVALGARLVSELSPTPDAGAAWFRAQMNAVRAKIERIVELGLHREPA